MVGEIVGSGVVQSVPVRSEDWAPKYKAEIGTIQIRSNPIPIGLLQQWLPEWKYLKYARGYTTVPNEYVGALQELLRLDRRLDTEAGVSPDEVEPSPTYREGSRRQAWVNAYERNAEARRRCLERYGTNCVICGFNFGKKYGPLGEGLIHVHHLKPLSEIAEEYEVNPITDLRPVCPNCHAVLHRHTPAHSIEEIKAILDQRST